MIKQTATFGLFAFKVLRMELCENLDSERYVTLGKVTVKHPFITQKSIHFLIHNMV